MRIGPTGGKKSACGAVAILNRNVVSHCGAGANFVSWRCGVVAILDRYVVLRCGVVPVLACKVCRGCGVFATNHRQSSFFGALLEEHVEAVRRRHMHSGGGLASKGAVHHNVQSALQ